MATNDRIERRKIVGEYVRERLAKECETTWGRAFEISKRVGFSAAHISNIKDGHRNVGGTFAMAMAEYWGMTYSQLEHLALERLALAYKHQREPAPPPPPDPQPSLSAILTSYRNGKLYPKRFLDSYEEQARQVPLDRPTEVWLADMSAKFWEWKNREKLEEESSRASSASSQGKAHKQPSATGKSGRREGAATPQQKSGFRQAHGSGKRSAKAG